MDDYNLLSSRTSSIDSTDSETTRQRDQNLQRTQLLQNDVEDEFISEICKSLSLEETENESRIIAKRLQINGRQELVHHRDNIRPVDFDDQMDNEGNSALLEILKRYFQEQWQQISFDWFQTFITEQQSKDKDKHYQQVLTRTAEYGQKYMKEWHVFSIVLRLVFALDDDINEDGTIFDNVRNTFAIDGCRTALKKWKKYIVPTVRGEDIDSHNSPLFLALREYFREPVLTLFDQSKISDQRNLLEVTLDCLAKDGWTAGLNDVKVKQLIAPKKYTSLMAKLGEYLEKNGLPSLVTNSSLDSSPVRENPVKESSDTWVLTTTSHPQDSHSQTPSCSLSDAAKFNDAIVAYIPDLPLQIADNHKLEDMIRQCLKRKHKQEVVDIKCSTFLGIGRVYLQNNNEKDHLINVLKSVILDSEEENDIRIKFSSDLELISYVVIESANDKNLPSPNDVAQRWVQFYQVRRPLSCEQLSVQFPNIFRIVSDSLDELIKSMARAEFAIDDQNATVYFRADCCFLEELPRKTSTHQLRHAINDQLSRENILAESFYIQYNRETSNAVILTSGRARKWALFDSINLDGRIIMKKNSLACRLLLRPIPKDFSIPLIQNHQIFENTVVKILPKHDRLILELSDRAVYEKCVNRGAIRVADQLLHMEVYPSNLEDGEINAENWYETEMVNHKPNIMPFIANPQHLIFHWKWNPQAFQEQFRRCATIDRGNIKSQRDHHGIDNNQKRHLLRMTVMLNTIGVVWKGSYRMDEREMKLQEDGLKTIVYDHQSKLQRGATMSLSKATQTPYTSTLIKVVDEDCLYVYQRLVAQQCRPVLLNMANADSPGGGYRKGDGAQEETLFRRSNYFRSLDIGLDNGKSANRFYCTSNCELEILSERQRMYPMDEFGAIYTSGLTVFRQAEDTGYAFMNEPLSDVCAIAMAAYRDPKVENNRLVPKYAIGMRRKIENIFAIAYHHKHDCLVLSALGCGAFKNPPEHIAAIFKSVAEQYAGFFKSIYFAIVDDHNTGLQFNPQGNYRPFKQLLDDMKLKPKEHKIQDLMIGPWRILNMPNPQQVILSDMRISDLTPCSHGGKCNDQQNVQHCREYSHPPLCLYSPDPDDKPTKLVPCSHSINCLRQEDIDHMKKYSHPCQYAELCRQKNKEPHLTHESCVVGHCPLGQSCKILDNPLHRAEYRHTNMPDFLIPCRHQQQCYDTSYAHRIKFSHGEHVELSSKDASPIGLSPIPPHDPYHHERKLDHKQRSEQIRCRDGLQCRNIRDAHHCSKYSHSDKQHHRSGESNSRPKISCDYGLRCRDIGNPDHCSKYSHPL